MISVINISMDSIPEYLANGYTQIIAYVIPIDIHTCLSRRPYMLHAKAIRGHSGV